MAIAAGARAGAVRVVTSWAPEERDAVLYAASGLFAVLTAETSSITLYRQWAELATVPYITAAVASALLARRARRRPRPHADSRWHWTTPRMLLFLLVLLGATLMPLSLEVLWRGDAPGTSHVQPEVPVVEASGARVAHGLDPYQNVDGSHRRITVPAGQPAYDAYNPYLPLMSVFGLARSTKAPARLTDARVAFSLITILVVVAALALCRGPTGPRLLALQSMTVLPTAALPLATGGDDLPVAALLLLGLVLLQRRRPALGGLAFGVAASMKITAWPLVALAPLAARGPDGRPGRRPALTVLAAMGAVILPAVLPSALANVSAFLDNVVRFPLGLAGIRSPAATPLLGHVVVTAFPGVHRLFPILVAGAGLLVLALVLLRRPPRSPAALARLLAWAFTVAILLAPATRIGYFLYPIDLFVWAWLLRGEDGSVPVTLSAASRPTGEDGEDDAEREPALVGPAQPWSETA